MAEVPEPLDDTMLDGSERIRVARRMRDAQGQRTGPPKTWTTSVADIIRFARAKSATVRSLLLGSDGSLSYQTTDGADHQLGSVAGPAGAGIGIGSGAPANASGSPGDLYVDAASGDLYRKDA